VCSTGNIGFFGGGGDTQGRTHLCFFFSKKITAYGIWNVVSSDWNLHPCLIHMCDMTHGPHMTHSHVWHEFSGSLVPRAVARGCTSISLVSFAWVLRVSGATCRCPQSHWSLGLNGLFCNGTWHQKNDNYSITIFLLKYRDQWDVCVAVWDQETPLATARAVAKRPMRLRVEIEIEWHSKCDRLCSKYRSLLQKSSTKETCILQRDLYFYSSQPLQMR